MAILTEYNKDWAKLYKAEAKRIKKAFGLGCTSTFHIGATAIKDMPARPIIDLLVVLTEKADLDKFGKLGYSYSDDGTFTLQNNNIEYSVRFIKHKVQLRPDRLGGNIIIEPYLAHILYLSENKDAAAEFAQKKREIAAQYEQDIDSYQAAKKQLIDEIYPTAIQYKKRCDKAAAYLPIGMCIGMGVGLCFGAAMNNIPVGMCIGMGVGMCIGVALGSSVGKKE